MAIRKYVNRLSGPILDRIDIQAQILPIRRSLLKQAGESEPSQAVIERVHTARSRQAERLDQTPWVTNAEVPGNYIRKQLPTPAQTRILDTAVANGTLTARGLDKVIRIAWTVADLAGADKPNEDYLSVALTLRQGESFTQ